jgi:serine/threonine protein kinase
LWNGRYQIRKEIGEGNYGNVFLARDITCRSYDSNKRVAIKVLKPPDDEDDDSNNENVEL